MHLYIIKNVMFSEQAINDAFAHAQKAKLTKAEGKPDSNNMFM